MAIFPAQFIDELRRRVSLSDVLSRYTALQKRGSKIVGCCPFHTEKTPSFYVYEEDGHYHCYGCKAHGDVFTLLMEKKGLLFPEVVEELAKQVGLPLPQDNATEKDGLSREKRELYYEIMEQATQFYQNKLRSSEGRSALRYAQDRGILPETLTQFRLGYAPTGNKLYEFLNQAGYKDQDLLALQLVRPSANDSKAYHDFFRHRLMFAIQDRQGRVVGFGGRILGPGEPKYLNSPETPLFHKSRIVYGYHHAKNARSHATVCVEGYMDVVTLAQAGFQGAVAPLGTAMTEEQIRLLWRLNAEPILCFDGDAAGQKAALRALEVALSVMQVGYSLRFITLSAGDDPDTLIQSGQGEALQHMLKNAAPLIDYLWAVVFAGAPVKTPEQQAIIEKKIFDLVDKIKDPILKRTYQKELLSRHKARVWQARVPGHKAVMRSYSDATWPGGQAPALPRTTLVAPLNAHTQQIKVLFAAILNHPQIFEEIEQEFLALDLDSQACHKLREEIVHYIIERNKLDKTLLNTHLCSRGHHDTIQSICNEKTYAHARFTRPDADPDKIVPQWRQFWWFCQGSKLLEQQIQQAQERFVENPTNENSAFLRRMQQERARLKHNFAQKV